MTSTITISTTTIIILAAISIHCTAVAAKVEGRAHLIKSATTMNSKRTICLRFLSSNYLSSMGCSNTRENSFHEGMVMIFPN